MATAFVSTPHAEDRSVLREISWETYVRLCDENQSRATQMAYFEGELEIMTIGWPHDTAKGLINFMFGIIAESIGLDFQDSGQHTFRHYGKKIGFEADLSYYVTNPERFRGRSKVELDTDPPPDLVVEVDISRNSERKLLMYSALGIREVWRCEGAEIRIYGLSGREYRNVPESAILPGVSAHLLTSLLADGARMNRIAWFAHIRKSAGQKSL